MKRFVLVFLFACGGDDPAPTDSGVDGSLGIGTLSADQIDAVCDYGVALSREVICNGNPTQSVTVFDACVGLLETIATGCTATVDDMETCFEDLGAETDDEVCALASPPSCDFLGDPTCIAI